MDATAAQQVFSTFELFELILGFLPERYLLLSQRISSLTKQTIDRSADLQQRLFFRPHLAAPDASESSAYGNYSSCVKMNPLLERAFPNWFVRKFGDPYSGRRVNIFPGHGNQEKANALARPEASWRRMLISQPPIEALFLTQLTGTNTDRVLKPESSFGLTMGNFFDATIAYGPPSPGSCFRMTADGEIMVHARGSSLNRRHWKQRPIHRMRGMVVRYIPTISRMPPLFSLPGGVLKMSGVDHFERQRFGASLRILRNDALKVYQACWIDDSTCAIIDDPYT